MVEKLRGYNAHLLRFCPENAGPDMGRFRVFSFVNGHKNPEALKITSIKADRQIQKTEDPEIRESLELLRDMANIKAIAGFYNAKPISGMEILRHGTKMFVFDAYQSRSTLALYSGEGNRSMVYVEFKSYADAKGAKLQGRQDDILKLGRLMIHDNAPDLLNTMTCMGLFKDSATARFGFVFRLPTSALANPRPGVLFAIDWDRRKPRRLLSLLTDTVHKPSDLRWRFNLAKRLVDNVSRLHACGWLHKNIRSDSVVFFLKNADASSMPYIDKTGSFLMGYDYVRFEKTVDVTAAKVAHEVPHVTSATPGDIQAGKDNRPDIYHHPDKRKSPDRAYQYAYDIYSLGIVLLEIGLWKPLHLVVERMENYDPDTLRAFLLSTSTIEQLTGCCGPTYTNFVKTFISMQSMANLDMMKLQREKCVRMAGELSRCVV